MPAVTREDHLELQPVAHDQEAHAAQVEVPSPREQLEGDWIDQKLLHPVGLRRVEARQALQHLRDRSIPVDGDIANLRVELEYVLGHHRSAPSTSVKPSSSQPVTPPIIFFTGRPSDASLSAALSAPLQWGPAQ